MLAQWKQHCSLVYHLHDNDTTEALLQKVLRISALLELSLGTISVRRRMPYLWASIRFNCEGDTVAIPLCRLSQRALPGALMRSSKLLKRRFMPDNIRGAHPGISYGELSRHIDTSRPKTLFRYKFPGAVIHDSCIVS